jgi:squalene-hopene/tetraprenyl-beta-curcumene cyclase
MALEALYLVDAHAHAPRIRAGTSWLAKTQHEDGGWGDAVVDSSNLNATSLALGALTLTDGDLGQAIEHVREHSKTWVDQHGGFAAVGNPDRCSLSGPCRTVAALAGILDWRRIKRLRPEVIFLPGPIRRTISTTYPAYLSIAILHASQAPHLLNALPSYDKARAMALEWLERAQGLNGSFEESAFLTSVIIACMVASGHGDLPWLASAVRFVVDSQREDGSWPIDRDLETFDTDLTIFALRAAGEPVPHAEAVRDWLLARQFDTLYFPTHAQPGGWAWAMPSGWPDADDTSYTLLALRALGVPESIGAIQRGAHWLAGMQNHDGSWSTFVRNSKMPFDHDCPYITGHALCALKASGWLTAHPRILDRALAYLTRVQRYDGSFASIWFREATAGTASVMEALADYDLLDMPMALRARDALLRSQNDDGGWAGLRRQESTAEETSWALMALLRFPHDDALRTAIQRGTGWLVARQHADGSWTPAPIGLYYSAMWYSDSYYAITLPTQALARARAWYVAT